jgi:hypothetical protein
MGSWFPAQVFFGALLTTVIHVYVFTGLFILAGSMKSRSRSGYASFAVFLACGLGLLLVQPKTSFAVTDYARANMGPFVGVIDAMLALLPSTGPDADSAIMAVGRFLGFAYTYHYLNWFSKTGVIRWHEIGAARMAMIGGLWLVSVALYWYDYATGLAALFFLSIVHVFFEFPLDARRSPTSSARAGPSPPPRPRPRGGDAPAPERGRARADERPAHRDRQGALAVSREVDGRRVDRIVRARDARHSRRPRLGAPRRGRGRGPRREEAAGAASLSGPVSDRADRRRRAAGRHRAARRRRDPRPTTPTSTGSSPRSSGRRVTLHPRGRPKTATTTGAGSPTTRTWKRSFVRFLAARPTKPLPDLSVLPPELFEFTSPPARTSTSRRSIC